MDCAATSADTTRPGTMNHHATQAAITGKRRVLKVTM
jgi:hypothetical protein